jgi:4-diphosphocytidyl-2-C-methyl-D-erythritol kinase
MIKILSPAKINMFLHVTGRRPDGYHNLFTLMCPVGLYDEVSLETGPEALSVVCSDPDVPDDETNLAYRAARHFLQQLASQHSLPQHTGLKISIKKRIPVAAGLGGGSSNAAAVLHGINHLFGNPFSVRELMAIGLDIGADVPFFIFGQPAIATGIGETLQPFANLISYFVLIIYPGIGVSTAEVYKNLDLGLTNCEKKLKEVLLKHEAYDAAQHSCNDLESFTLSRYPEIRAAKKSLLKQGAVAALMSGSGSSVFGLFDDLQAAKNARLLLDETKTWQLFLTEMIVLDSGLRIVDTAGGFDMA